MTWKKLKQKLEELGVLTFDTEDKYYIFDWLLSIHKDHSLRVPQSEEDPIELIVNKSYEELYKIVEFLQSYRRNDNDSRI